MTLPFRCQEAIGDFMTVFGPEGEQAFLIGASARILVADDPAGLRGRATLDVDLAIPMAGWQAFEDAALRLHPAFPTRLSEHRFRHRNGTDLDLVPFGGLARKDGTIVWPSTGQVMFVRGLSHAAKAVEPAEIAPGKILHIASLPALLLLKAEAWRSRGAATGGKDLVDIDLLIRAWSAMLDYEALAASAASDLRDGSVTFEHAGALLLGRRLALTFGLDALDATVALVREITADPYARSISILVGWCADADEDLRRRSDAAARYQALGRGLGLVLD